MSTNMVHPLGEIIKKAIKGTGIPQAVIADRMEVTRQAINKIHLRKTFDLEFLQKLKDASGLDYTDYVFNPKNKKYESLNSLTATAAEPTVEYQSNIVTLTFNVGCPRDKVGDFSQFLTDMEAIAGKYQFKIK